MATFDELRAVKRRHAASLLRQEGVCGVDIDEDDRGEPIIAIHLDTDDPRIRGQLPDALEGHPVKLILTGPVRKQAAKRR